MKRSRKDKNAKPRAAGPKSDPLPSNVKDLQAMVIALQHQVAQLQRMLFGRRSETLLADHPSQGFLFGRIEPQEPPAEPFDGSTASGSRRAGELTAEPSDGGCGERKPR